jgi:hypothetical protein
MYVMFHQNSGRTKKKVGTTTPAMEKDIDETRKKQKSNNR